MTTSYQAKYSLRNVKVDSPANANDYLLETGQPQTKDNAAHVDAQAISISIQRTRIMGRYEDAIREHIDGSYLRHYLSDKQTWTDSTWSWIDCWEYLAMPDIVCLLGRDIGEHDRCLPELSYNIGRTRSRHRHRRAGHPQHEVLKLA